MCVKNKNKKPKKYIPKIFSIVKTTNKTNNMCFNGQTKSTPTFWIFRVGDGENFNRSKNFYSSTEGMWGSTHGGRIDYSSPNLTKLKHINHGDILLFVKKKNSCQNGEGNVVGIAEFEEFWDRENSEDTENIHTNEELGWTGDGWRFELKFKNLFTNTKNIKCIFGAAGSIHKLSTAMNVPKAQISNDIPQQWEIRRMAREMGIPGM